MELFERSTRRYHRPEWNIESHHRRRRARAGACRNRVGAPVLQAAAFRARLPAHAAPAATETADRRADVGPLSDAAARHGGDLPAQSRRLSHRMGRRAHGAGQRRPLRSRRLYRLHHLHAALSGRRRACDRGVPAFGAGAGGGGADGSRPGPLRAAFHGADGRADRHPHQSQRGQRAGRGSRHRLVPQQRHHQGAVPASRLHARRLSGLSAVARLHEHEPRPPPQGAPRPVPAPGQAATAIRRRSIASSTTNISRSWI